ncbi:hypothetical protein EG329_006782 [Mollisiaceae sp. DMI_Dod_QoI]|nr:hypothetical protein EG329_006782 [Helotiales sp. DMI_Dod_QoI]
MEQALDNSASTIYDVNLLIGRNFSDPELQNTIKTLPYEIVEKDDRPFIKGRLNGTNHYFDPAEISTMIVRKLKDIAEAYLGQNVSYAVITVPTDFNDLQRQATKDAGTMAGIEVLRFFNESTAVVAGYGLDTPSWGFPDKDVPDYFVIYHLDAKESKLALISVWDGVIENLVLTNDTKVKGEDFQEHGFRNMELSEKAINLVERLLKEASFEKTQVDDLVFVGDPHHIAYIQPSIESYLGKKARSIETPSLVHVRPDEAIIRGIVRQARWMEGGDDAGCSSIDVVPLDLGIEMSGGVYARVLRRWEVIPMRRTRTFVTTRDNQEKVLIKVFEGLRKTASKNRLLGTLELMHLPLKPRGELEIEVIFEMDWAYTLTVIAREKESGKEASFIISPYVKWYLNENIYKAIMEGEDEIKEDVLSLRDVSFPVLGEKERDEFQVMPKEGGLDNNLDFLPFITEVE